MEHYCDFDKKIAIIINVEYGGYWIPDKAYPYLMENGYEPYESSKYNNFKDFDPDRFNPVLVNAIIAHPELFNKKNVCLRVKFVPLVDVIAGSIYINDYDGKESIRINKEKTKLFLNSLKMNSAFENTLKIANSLGSSELIKSLEELRPEVYEPRKLPPFIFEHDARSPNNL
jgi:hypothetical protein